MPKILNRLGNRFTAFSFASITFLSLLVLALVNNAFFVILAFVLFFISMNFLFASLDIFVEDISLKTSVGKFRGLFLMVSNLAWVLAQLVSGSVINKSSFQGIYLLSAGFMFLVSIVFIFCLESFKDPNYTKVPILKTVKTFVKNSSLRKIYLINLILKLFFAWMVIYIPIYLHEYLKFNWQELGIIFTVMLIPFVLVDYPLGRLSDRMGEKKILIAGFLVSIIFTFLIPFIKQPGLWLWALILFGTRIGAATIEVMSESYFFKEVKEKNADEVSFFRNTYPLSYIIAPAIAIPALVLLEPNFEYLFLVVTIFLLIGLFVTLRLKDIK